MKQSRRKIDLYKTKVDGELAAAIFDREGFVVVPDAVAGRECDRLSQIIDASQIASAGSRKMLDHAWCRELVVTLRQRPPVQQLLPADAVAIQCTLFEKSFVKNWLVAMHQDLSVCVARQVLTSEWSNWSEKEGLAFVQPPRTALASLVAVRLHLDDCPASAGALHVIPKSHHKSIGNNEPKAVSSTTPVPVHRGDALVLRPLLSHGSRKATVPSRRRVLHFLFAPGKMLDGIEDGLSWRWRI